MQHVRSAASAAPTGTSDAPPRWTRGWLSALREVALVLGLFTLYRAGRALARGRESEALHHAAQVHGLEAALHLPSEAAIQAAVGTETLLRAANTYYVSVHFPVMIAFLLVGYLARPRADYRWARNLVATQTGLALTITLLFPLAPPRMFPQWGFEDSMSTLGPSAYSGSAGGLSNQLAAMPSLHVGWAVLIAYVVVRTGPRWLRGPAVLHALVTAAVVLVTANHWWLDGIAACLLLAVAVAVFPAPVSDRGLLTTGAHS